MILPPIPPSPLQEQWGERTTRRERRAEEREERREKSEERGERRGERGERREERRENSEDRGERREQRGGRREERGERSEERGERSEETGAEGCAQLEPVRSGQGSLINNESRPKQNKAGPESFCRQHTWIVDVMEMHF